MLQKRDVDLLRTVHDFRLISTGQILQLFSDESRDGIYRRLQKLFHCGYLDRLGRNPNAPLVYALGGRGAEVLEAPYPKGANERYVAHRLMIGDFRIAMTLAAREREFEMTWRATGPDLPVRPDGFFTLRYPWLPDGRNRAHFFLEADRSTMPRDRFVGKLLTYRDWWLAGGSAATLGIRAFRVLTVTRSEERLAGLLRAAANCQGLQDWHPPLWFTSRTRFTASQPGSIVASVWETPAEPGVVRTILP